MKTKHLANLLVLGAILCGSRDRDMALALETPDLPTYEEAVEAAGIVGVTQSGSCNTCHDVRSQQTYWSWGGPLFELSNCLNEAQRPEAKDRLDCLEGEDGVIQAGDLGIYAARPSALPIRELLKEVYPEDFETRYQEIEARVQMPRGSAPLSDQDFQKVLKWVYHDALYLDQIVHPYDGETECKEYISDEMKQHIRKMSYQGWQAKNRSEMMSMFACDGEGARCFTQRTSDLKRDLFPRTVPSKSGFGALFETLKGEHRLLHAITGSTSYWLRSSADGRFVAYAQDSGHILDLASKLDEQAPDRVIDVDAYYDPTFFPDNQGFIFQGESSGFCRQTALLDPLVSHIDFSGPFCSNDISLSVSLYQSVGASLNGGDYMVIASSFEGDSGQGVPNWPSASPFSNVGFSRIAFDGQNWVFHDQLRIETPWMQDFSIAPSQMMLAGRKVAGVKGTYLELGYEVFGINEVPVEEPIEQLKMEPWARICQKGKKVQMSFDDRFLVTHEYVEPEGQKSFSRIILIDLLTLDKTTIAEGRPGTHLMFPHFRSDGIIYYLVHDVEQDKRYLMASFYAKDVAGAGKIGPAISR